MPLLAHPRLTAWAARLIQAPASSLAWHQRLMRRRLLLGTQMTDVEADMYDRGLWFFGLIAVGTVPFGLIGLLLVVHGMLEGRVNLIQPMGDEIFASVFIAACLMNGFLSPLFVALPLIGRSAAQIYKIPPQPYQTWTEQVVQHAIFRTYLLHLMKHRRWNPVYRLCCYVARAGAGYYGMEGHTHRDTPVFSTYSCYRALAPVGYFALLISMLGVYDLIFNAATYDLVEYVMTAVLGTMGILISHFFIGKIHGDVFEVKDLVSPGIVTREMALKSAVYSSVGGAIAINFHHIKAWVLSWF